MRYGDKILAKVQAQQEAPKRGRRSLAQIVKDNAEAEGPTAFSCFCPGIPRPQGSKRHVGNGVMLEGSKHLAGWRRAMVDAFALEARQQGIRFPFSGPLGASYVFLFPQGKARLKTQMPGSWHTCTPDADKLERAVNDALKIAGVVKDDALIAVVRDKVKRYAAIHETPGVLVKVWKLRSGEAVLP